VLYAQRKMPGPLFGDMCSEVVHIHGLSNSTLLVVPDRLRDNVEKAFGIREVVCERLRRKACEGGP
jgi:hypothetical protein